jgi:site-specific recombinase XerD
MDETARDHCRETIERFLDRSWMLDRVALRTLRGNRFALLRLDDWLQRHRVVTLADVTAQDLRALLRSEHWDAVSRRCESLLGLVTRFFQSLRDHQVRPDDPVETLIDQELLAAANQRATARESRRDGNSHRLVFSRTPVL